MKQADKLQDKRDIKSLLRIMLTTLFVTLISALAVELFWLNSTPEQCQ